MRDAIALYLRYVGISIRGQLQYRASFVLQVFGHVVMTGAEFVAIWALFDRFGALAGWSLPEVALLYGMAEITFALSRSLSTGFDRFGAMVVAGDFDRILVRPRSAVLQLLGQELTLRRVGRLAQGAAVLVWAVRAGGVEVSVDRILLFLAAVAGGVCLHLGLAILQATSAFWTVETLELWGAFTDGGNYAAQYPINIYRPWFRRFFTVVIPLACVVYLPGLAILGKPDPLGSPVWLQYLAPLGGVAFLAVCLQVWKLGIRRYTATGS